jgi:type I restriction enzyme S subunit
MSFPHYEHYKDGGNDWLGKIPSHWEIISLGRLTLDKCDGPFGSGLKSEHYTDEGIRVVRLQNIRSDGFDGSDAAFIDELYYRQCLMGHDVKQGDLLIAGLGDDRNTVGRACVAPTGIEPAMVKADCFRFRLEARRASAKFIAFQLTAGSPYDAGVLSSGSTRSRISLSEMATRKIALPPIVEQSAITAFLGRETVKIDALVNEQRRLIDYLDEKITAMVFAHLGSPDTRELRLGQAADLITRPVEQKDDDLYIPLGIYNRGRGLFHKEQRQREHMGESDFFWVESGDLIISGQFAWEGSIALASDAETKCVVSHRYHLLRGKSCIALTEYLLALLSTKHGDFLLNENSRGAAGRNRPLNINSLLKETIPVPAMPIQEDIANAVHQKIQLVAESKKQCEVLQERRSALISAAVTGKIDVRGLIQSEAEAA